MKKLRGYLVAGLIVLIPVLVTWQVLYWLFNLVDGILAGVVNHVFKQPIPGLGLVVTVIIVILVGMLAANYFGRRIIHYGETAMRRTPIVRGVYVAIKQLTDAFVRQEQAAFSKVCLIEYPRKGIYSLGFVTSSPARELTERTGAELVSLFVPTTPNPTSGFLLYVPRQDVIFLDMAVEDGLKLVISGGIVVPKEAAAVAPDGAASTDGEPEIAKGDER